MPKPPTKSKFAERTLAVAKAVGGKQGRALSLAVRSSLEGAFRPTTGSRTLVGSQVSAVKAFLGAFQPVATPIAVKHKMRKHAQIRFCAAAAKAPLLRGDVWFDTNSTELQSLLNRVFIESGLVKKALRTSLLAVDYGFSAHEQIWDIAPEFTVGWDVPTAEQGKIEHREKNYANLFYPKQLKELRPENVVLLEDRFGEYAGLLYGAPEVFPTSEEDMRKILEGNKMNALGTNKSFVFTLDGEWQNHYGCGRLDSAYDPWYWQNLIYLICNRWFERKGDPPLIGRAPSSSAIADPGVDADEFDQDDESESPVILISRALDRLRSTGTLGLPSDVFYDEDGKPGTLRAYDVEELDVKDAHPAFKEYIEHLDVKISRSYLVPDAIAASQKGMGTYGSLQTMAEVYVETQNDTLSAWVERFNEVVIQPFLQYNGIKDRATLRTHGINSSNRDALKSTFDKVLDADMLAEQAFGRIFPASYTSMIDREALARLNNIPYKRPDPDAPAPTPPQSPESAAAGAGAGASGPQRGPAKKAKAAAITIKMTEEEFVASKVSVLVRERKMKHEEAVAEARRLYKVARSKARAAQKPKA